MRELFDEAAGQYPLDPHEAARQSARTPQRKRFYKEAGIAEAEGGFAITLDGKPIRTPSRPAQVVSPPVLAHALAAEWAAQGDTIDPVPMPLTRLANAWSMPSSTASDSVADDLGRYLRSDLLFYRAAIPEGLVPARLRMGTRAGLGCGHARRAVRALGAEDR